MCLGFKRIQLFGWGAAQEAAPHNPRAQRAPRRHTPSPYPQQLPGGLWVGGAPTPPITPLAALRAATHP